MRHVFPLLALVLAGFAPAPFPKPTSRAGSAADLALLQGKWTQTRPRLTRQDPRPDAFTLTISGRTLTFSRSGALWTMDLDAAARPKRLDLHHARSGDRMLLIYRIEGDVLTLAWSKDDSKDRPTDFAVGSRTYVYTYVRKK